MSWEAAESAVVLAEVVGAAVVVDAVAVLVGAEDVVEDVAQESALAAEFVWMEVEK